MRYTNRRSLPSLRFLVPGVAGKDRDRHNQTPPAGRDGQAMLGLLVECQVSSAVSMSDHTCSIHALFMSNAAAGSRLVSL